MIGSIYKLSCNISGKSYVGSTRQPLNKRLQGHISSYRKGQNMASAQIIANGDYKIEELECVECDDPRELLKREQYHMDRNDCCNYKRAFLLPEQTFSKEVLFAPNLEMLVPLKSKWRVSIAAMVKRLRQLRLISREREQRLFINISRRRWRTKEPLDDELEIEKPRVLQKALDVLREKNIINQQSLTINIALNIEDIERTIGMPGYFCNASATTIKFPRIF